MRELACPSIRVALFDFDGTLCRLNSWHVFLRWLLGKRDRHVCRVCVALVARKLRLLSSAQLKNVVLKSLCGKSSRELEAIGCHLYQEQIRPNLRPMGLKELRRCQDDGYRVFVVSGAFDFMVRPFCQEFSVPLLGSTCLSMREDICTGQLDGDEMLGERKVRCVHEQLAHLEIDWSASHAYSDELSDLPLLGLVGRPVFVHANPKRLRELPRNCDQVLWA